MCKSFLAHYANTEYFNRSRGYCNLFQRKKALSHFIRGIKTKGTINFTLQIRRVMANQNSKNPSVEGIGDEGFGDKVFPKELMRRRWSMKEIVTIVVDELSRNGRLRRKLREIKKEEER